MSFIFKSIRRGGVRGRVSVGLSCILRGSGRGEGGGRDTLEKEKRRWKVCAKKGRCRREREQIRREGEVKEKGKRKKKCNGKGRLMVELLDKK